MCALCTCPAVYVSQHAPLYTVHMSKASEVQYVILYKLDVYAAVMTYVGGTF